MLEYLVKKNYMIFWKLIIFTIWSWFL